MCEYASIPRLSPPADLKNKALSTKLLESSKTTASGQAKLVEETQRQKEALTSAVDQIGQCMLVLNVDDILN